MKKFFPIYDIKSIDRRTEELQGLDTRALIDRAARALLDWTMAHYTRRRVVVLAGPGNNGADGIALAVMLREKGWVVDVHTYAGHKGYRSPENEAWLTRLLNTDLMYDENETQPDLTPGCLVVDALFGTGLKRPLEGPAADVASFVNDHKADVLAIDMPSGLGSEADYNDLLKRTVIKAKNTVCFQFPKLAFFLPELNAYIGTWHVCDIHLAQEAIDQAPTFLYYTSLQDSRGLVRPRNRFAHKGTVGHSLLVAGSRGMSGAAILAAKGCLGGGTGLLTVASAEDCYVPLQSAVPEAMCLCNQGTGSKEQGTSESLGEEWPEGAVVRWWSGLELPKVSAVGVGPGLRRGPHTVELLRGLLKTYAERCPLVVDADGLHALRTLLDEGVTLPEQTILTPHPLELDALTEPHNTHLERIEAACLLAIRLRVVVVLKGAFTMTALPDGRRVFNTTGNAGMATGGSGDVLTGLLTALLAQGYPADEAALLGVALHAAAGDAAAETRGQWSLTAQDIAAHLADAWLQTRD